MLLRLVRIALLALSSTALLAMATQPHPAEERVAWLWDKAKAPSWSATEVAVVTRHYLLTDNRLLFRPRMQAASLQPLTRVTPVIHVELSTVRPPYDFERHRQILIDAVLDAAHTSTSGTVQLDMEARPSHRAFYLTLVRDIRKALPTNMRLSVTALAWWCRSTVWMDELAADEVVPMFFQMGRDSSALRHIVELAPEQLHARCRSGAAGFSTQEAFDSMAIHRYTRTYWFDKRRWHEDTGPTTQTGK